MALSTKDRSCDCADFGLSDDVEVYRVIDDGTCVMTTLNARKALLKLMEVMEKHDVHVCWADCETLE